jgi:hypothetical protein
MRGTFAAVFVFLFSAGALAQSPAQAIDDVRKDARVRFGGVYLTPHILLREAGMDSNVYNSKGEPESDFTFTVAPVTDVWLPVARKALFTTRLGADYLWFAKNEDQRSLNPTASFRADVFLHRLTLTAAHAFSSNAERPNQEIDIRYRRYENTSSAGIGIRLTPKLGIELSGNRSQSEHDDEAVFLGTKLQETLNRTTGGASVTVRHRLTALTSVAIQVERFGDRFELAPDRDADSLRIMPSVEFKPRALISGRAAVGFRRFEPKNKAIMPGYTGLAANLGLSYTHGGTTTVGVTYLRDLNYSFQPLQPYFVNTTIGGSLRRALGGRFDVLGSVDQYNYQYRSVILPNVAPSDDTPRQFATWNYAASLGYKIGRNGRMGFGFSYWRRAAESDSARDYNRLRIGTTVNYGF